MVETRKFSNGKAYCSECHKVKAREWHLKDKYGLTEDDYEAMLIEQDNTCAICEKPIISRSRRTHIDHNHTTGKVRGLLCVNCNRGLGIFEDDVTILQRAIEYIRQ